MRVLKNIESDTIMVICVESGGAKEKVTSVLKLQKSTSYDITALTSSFNIWTVWGNSIVFVL